MEMASRKQNMRRSCHFCRSRKIRCSGESICTACRERNIECVYDLEASKGRPRGSSTRSTTGPSLPGLMDGGYVSPSGSLLMSDDLSSRPGSRSGSPKDGFLLDDPPRSDMDMTNSIAAELEIMFKENFGTECDVPKTNTYQERFSAFNAKVKGTERSASTETLSPRSTPLSPLNYRGLLSLLTQDLVETLVTKFGGLGCQPFFAEEGRFFVAAKALLSVFPVREEMNKVASPVVAGSPCPFPHSYILGLDACGRALDYFCTRFQEGTEAEIKILSENLSELLHLAQSMHTLFKNDDVLLQDRRWRAVKKQLKSVRKRVEEFHRPGHSRTASVDSYATTTDESLVHTLSTGATSAASPTTTPLHAGFGSSVDLNSLSPLMFDNPMMPMSASLPLSDDVPFLEEDVMSVPLNSTLNGPHDLWLGFTNGSTTSAADPSLYSSTFVDDFSGGIKRRNMSYSTVDNSAHIDAFHHDPTFAPSMYLNFGTPTPVPSDVEHPPRKKARANTTPEPSMFSVPFHPAMSRT